MINKKDITHKNIVLFGIGAVGRCNLSYFEKYFIINYHNILMLDIVDNTHYPIVKEYINKGAIYGLCDINVNYKKIIDNLKPYDIIIDLTFYTDSLGISKYCVEHDIHYINTSLEETHEQIKNKTGFNESYQYMHNYVNTLKNDHKNGVSQMLCCGMNPGLITTFTNYGLLEMSKKIRSEEMTIYRKNNDFANICRLLEVELIICAETDDSHFIDNNNVKQKFYNTWCCNAFLAENDEDAQITWGTHEKTLPSDKSIMISDHILNIGEKAKDIYLKSTIIDDGDYIGVCIPHSENIYSADCYSTNNYSPSIYYCYKYAPVCHTSLNRYKKILNKKNYLSNKDTHVLNNYDDKFNGTDKVGALIVTKNKQALWCGSVLNNKDDHIEDNSATTAQVSISIMAFLSYILDNKNKGIMFPDDADHKYIIKLVKPYIGFRCEKVNYNLSTQFNDLRVNKKQFDQQY